MLISDINVEQYNTLLDPIMADKELFKNPNKDVAFNELGEEIIKRGYHNYVALRLVHKHHVLNPGHRMVESNGVFDGRQALITKACKEKDYRKGKLIPNVLAASDNGFKSLEYAVPEVFNNFNKYEDCLKDDDFISATSKIILRHGLQNVLGIGGADKKLFDIKRKNSILIERTNNKELANILMWLEKEKCGKSIQTLWKFAFSKDNSCALNVRMQPALPETGPYTPPYGGYAGCEASCLVVCEIYSPGHAYVHKINHTPWV